MPSPDEAIAAFLISIASGIVLGVVALFLVYKMIDGDLKVGPGLGALIMIALVMALSIKPPHPVVPGVVLVLSLGLIAFFPYAENKLEEFELRAVDANRLRRCYESVKNRPDNFAAKFELAHMLHAHGFVSHAVNLTASTLSTLSTEQDEVKNRSLRDVFHREEVLLKRWQGEPQNAQAIKCPNCGAYNRSTDIFCTSCDRPYMLDLVQGQEVKPRVWAKLILGFAAVALFIPTTVAIAMNLDGIVRILAFTGGMVVVGGILAWLFKPPKYAPTYGTSI